MNGPTIADHFDTLAAKLLTVAWDDLDDVERAAFEFFEDLTADPSIVHARLEELPDRPELLNLCEHYDILDKIVLFADEESGVRVRLHVFLPGYFDRPHNHRWTYASRILRGQYRHYLFGNAELDDHVDPQKLEVIQVREEPVGVGYALHHTMVHAVVAEPFTVSLVVRGPAVKDRFLVTDRQTGEAWWQYGAGQESAQEALQKRMTPARLQEVIGRLAEWDLF
ncbi:hypothetical protein ACQPW1_10175 [Nocardia sp. CA-128927]|uniref:hypothetical protein n=1 Tax=Nocardia sp. CA-128927 TaxID=3239975 RepID=UPI003D96A4A8